MYAVSFHHSLNQLSRSFARASKRFCKVDEMSEDKKVLTISLELVCWSEDWRGVIVSKYLWNVEERVGTGSWGRVVWDA